MLNNYFYHAIIRKTVAAFGSLFNDIKVIRKDAAGEVKQISRVPLAYGPTQKFLARIEAEPNFTDPAVAIKLPRLSFEITSLTYDAESKINKMNQFKSGTISDGSREVVYAPAPYKIGLSLSVITKNQDDALQVLEQIIPYFQPEYTITVNDLPDLDLKHDLPIVLNSVSMTEDYEGDFVTRRAIIYTMEFETRVRFFGPTATKSVILTSSADINDFDTYGFLEEVTTETVSQSAKTYTVGIDTTDDNEITS